MSSSSSVKAWAEHVTIPTYDIGNPNPNPMFLEKRVYQGSSGVVYPYPVIETVADEPKPQEWEAVFLENEYLKIMVLPALGGRIQMALDKTNDYHFVYYNQVIKPALVGLAGPWISGGIEFNWPQHHRPNTYGPVEWQIEETEEGACTVWCSEIDRMYGTKGMHGLTLNPGKAYLEIKVQLSNRTDLPQTFLWWANPAVAAGDDHQSIFPPDVHAVMDHGKRDSISFPVAVGEYYKVNYSPGTDISRYRNIPVPTSYMAYHSDYNFVGSYDHSKEAGLLHVCDHHVSPGKKQWTWGHSDFGQAWDRQLTDEDGPYIELMCGVFTDNQPDFSWLMPGEQKSFTQYFMPYKKVAQIGNATIDAAIGMNQEGDQLSLRAYATSLQVDAKVIVVQDESEVFSKTLDLGPESPFEEAIELPSGTSINELRAAVLASDGSELVSWQPAEQEERPVPEPATAIDSPDKLDSTEALFLAGQHLEQYRHATRLPEYYYLEALKRDPEDSRNNMAMASLSIRRGQFVEAESYARTAVKRLTRHNPNPYVGEAHYQLGMALEWQGNYEKAADAYHKATWNAAWQAAAGLAIARLETRSGNYNEALQRIEWTLCRNTEDHRAWHLKVTLLRLLGREQEATQAVNEALKKDSFNFGILWEEASDTNQFDRVEAALRNEERNYLAIAWEYASSGLYHKAVEVMTHCLEKTKSSSTPMPLYFRSYYNELAGNDDSAKADREAAAKLPTTICFPNRTDELLVLQQVVEKNPSDAKAPYYLGCLLYHLRQTERAVAMWQRATELDPSFPTAYRNLGLAYFNKLDDASRSWEAYLKAFECDTQDARLLYELDQLAKRLGHSIEERYNRLAKHESILSNRDDLYIEHVTLLNLLGKHEEALEQILARNFHPWEGGEGKVPAQFVFAITSLARQAILDGKPDDAISLLKQTECWPHSLGEGKLFGTQENDIHYLMGLAYQTSGDQDSAKEYLDRASQGLSEPTAAVYYNDQPPEMIFFQGLAHLELGTTEEANNRFMNLIEYGQKHLDDEPEIDFFAVSLPDFLVFEDSLTRRNKIHCYHMMALGHAGLGNQTECDAMLVEIRNLDPSHPGLKQIPEFQQATADA